MATPNFILDSNSPCQDLLFPHSIKPHKNTCVLVDTVLKEDNFMCFPRVFHTFGPWK